MEEAQYRINRLRDEMDHYILSTSHQAVQREQLDLFFGERRQI